MKSVDIFVDTPILYDNSMILFSNTCFCSLDTQKKGCALEKKDPKMSFNYMTSLRNFDFWRCVYTFVYKIYRRVKEMQKIIVQEVKTGDSCLMCDAGKYRWFAQDYQYNYLRCSKCGHERLQEKVSR